MLPHPPSPPTAVATPAPGPPPLRLPAFDPLAGLGEHVQRALAELLASLIRPVRDAVADWAERCLNILTATRPQHTLGLPQVQALHAAARAVANAAVALMVMAGGYNLAFRRHLTGDAAELWPLLGRLALASSSVIPSAR